MKEEDKWILECDSIKVNETRYWFRCVWSFAKKAPNEDKPAMTLVFNIYKEGEGWISWDDFRGSYFAEKFTAFVKNTMNGQRAICWNNEEGRHFK